ncbi:hypothetical protein [Polyangium fumosum]|uniref:Tetratricopeptide repeat protein n=1 Tax=Polyangium fumosum TaxID=889272 RepID=A0A4U1JE47_9BACT|nr:hypothetical protein [Polyangium fumosum]TKD07560.1 hypothetical protein E8A74_17485 [Polyangium fumosum]
MGSTLRWVGVAFVSALCSGRAYAGPAADRAAADALFQEARALAKEGRLAEACPKFAASQKLDPRPGRLLALGDCYERAAQTASAWATFREAESAARVVNDEARREEASRRAGELQPRLSKLVIEVEAGARVAGLEVRRNGQVVEEAVWGEAVPVDPGEQVIEAGAPGKKGWAGKVVAEGEGAVVRVKVPVLREEGKEEKAGAAKEEGAGKNWVAVGVGGGLAVVGVGVGVGLFVAASGVKSDVLAVRDVVPEAVCNPVHPQRNDYTTECALVMGKLEQRDTFMNVGTGLLVAGGVFAVGTVVYALVPSKTKRTTTGFSVLPAVAPTFAGFAATGQF